jgi:hypothetical protein
LRKMSWKGHATHTGGGDVYKIFLEKH